MTSRDMVHEPGSRIWSSVPSLLNRVHVEFQEGMYLGSKMSDEPHGRLWLEKYHFYQIRKFQHMGPCQQNLV